MAPITLQRLIRQLDKLKPKADAARLKRHDYARWLARMIRRLRERSLDADRAAATVALAEALKRGADGGPHSQAAWAGEMTRVQIPPSRLGLARVQHLSHLHGKGVGRKRLVEERGVGRKDAAMHDRVLGVPRHEQ